jgi:hypothetical protein
MPNRTSGWAARAAALRAARRRSDTPSAREASLAAREPLPPLVCPDDDREFAEPSRPPHLEPMHA